MENDCKVAMINAVAGFAMLAIKSLILVNGGAVIAILTFLGNADGDDAFIVQARNAAVNSLGFFVWGVAAVLATAGFSYMAQVCFAETDHGSTGHKCGQGFRGLAVGAALVSLGLFCGGAFRAQDSFREPPAETPAISAPATTC